MTGFEAYLHTVLTRAADEAADDGSPSVEAHHLLLAIAGNQEPGVRQVLDAAGLDRAAVHAALERELAHSLSLAGVTETSRDLPRPHRLPANPRLGTSARLAIERGFASAPRKKDLRPPHVLLGVLAAEVGAVPRALALAGVDTTDLAARLRRTLTDAS